MQVRRIKEVNDRKSHVFFRSSCWTVSQCKNLVQALKWYRITVIKFISIRLCCVFHFVSFQTKHGFDIGIGPVSFNLTSLDKDTPHIRVGFGQVPFFFNSLQQEIGV